MGLQPVFGNPAAGGVDAGPRQQSDGDEDDLERAQQAARFGQLGKILRLPAVMGDLPDQRGRQSGIEQLQPGLQHREEADQPIRLGAQMAEVERQDDDTD